MTCSPDCYTVYVVDRVIGTRFKRTGKQNKSSRIKTLQGTNTGKHITNCDYCGTLFKADNKRQRFCTPQCSILAGNRDVDRLGNGRRIPGMPKMPWDE